MKGGENMGLMVKDLMQNLENGNRVEKHLNDRLTNKKQQQSSAPVMMWGTANYLFAQYDTATQIQQQLGTTMGTLGTFALGNKTGGI